MNVVTLSHGNGGRENYDLINNIFWKHFNNPILMQKGDSTILNPITENIAVTTDSFVVNPIFFPGGNIGSLSIFGTINDLAVRGAKPLYITAGFIIEEGTTFEELDKIAMSMSESVKEADAYIVAGDTKVVGRREGNKVYINTTGIGTIGRDVVEQLNPKNIQVGDKVIVSGTLGEHSLCIMNQRESLGLKEDIYSDCCSLYDLTKEILANSTGVRFMRDVTRGGIGTTLNEIIGYSHKSMIIYEQCLPVRDEVKNICELLGIDPIYCANEGKLICIVAKEEAYKVLEIMKKNKIGKDSVIIGEVIEKSEEKLFLKTYLGSKRVITMASGQLIPRIC